VTIFKTRFAFQQLNSAGINTKLQQALDYLTEFGVRTALLVSISQRSEWLRLYNLVSNFIPRLENDIFKCIS
jgi:hypothetical protein